MSQLYSAKIKLFFQIMNLSDDCLDYVDENPDPTNSRIAITLFLIVYTHIFILGLAGNISIVFLTLRHRHLRTVQNIFILNLGIRSDIFVIVYFSNCRHHHMFFLCSTHSNREY